jgi:tetratricopeptide (TPR) repeat protein
MDQEKKAGINIGGGQVNVVGDMVGGNKYVQEAPVPVVPALHQLPPPPRDFTGRSQELRDLIESVTRSGVTICGVQGLGGVGKTTLALKIAEQLTSLYPDAQFYLDLKGVSDKSLTPQEAMSHVVRAFYPSARLPEGVAELSGLYQSVLHNQRALLLLDNAKDEHQVAPLIPPPSCLLLVTSRQNFSLPGLVPKHLDSLAPADACDLLVRIAPRLAQDRKDHSGDLARLCGYLPLALRSVASTLAARVNISPADYVLKMADAQERLKLTATDASLQLSYQLLPEDVKDRFLSLAIFPGTFSSSAAAVVWDEQADAAIRVLGELITYSLLEFNATTTRYRLHDLVRVFAQTRLEKYLRALVEPRFSKYYDQILKVSNDLYEMGGEAMMQGLALFDAEWLNIRAGMAWAAEHAAEDNVAAALSVRYPSFGIRCLELRLPPRERIRWLEIAISSARKLKDRLAEAQHLGNLGIAFKNLGEYQHAIKCYEQSLSITREIGERGMEANLLGNLGTACRNLGDFARAIVYQEQRLQIIAELGDRRGEGSTLGNIGSIYGSRHQWSKAVEYYEKALKIARETDDRRAQISTLCNLGTMKSQLNETESAREYQQQGLQIARAIGDRKGEAETLLGMGLVFDQVGDRANAVAHVEAALIILDQIESPYAASAREQLAEWDKEP